MGRMKFWMAKGLKILLNPPALNHCSLDPTSKVCARSELTGCRVGRYSYIGYQCFMVNTQVGAFCSIADGELRWTFSCREKAERIQTKSNGSLD